ncbi:hypothetical protein DMENIID0001_064380 [Sergentomyia squamirostris]
MGLDEIAGKCRACQEETSEESQILIYSDKNLKDIFHDVTSIKIEKEDKLPGVLCVKCHTRLLDAHQFRQMCAVSALKFHKILARYNSIPKKSKKHCSAKKKKKHKENNVNVKEAPKTAEEETFHPIEYISVELPENHTEVISFKQEKEEFDDTCETFNENPEIPESKMRNIKPDPDEEIEKEKSLNEEQNIPDVEQNKNPCLICKKSFQTLVGLMTHVTKIHENQINSVCLICAQDCLSSNKLAVHLKEVHDAPEGLTCNVCRRTYQNRVTLLMHIRRLHSGLVEYKRKPRTRVICEQCGKSFHSRSGLEVHSYTHSGLRPFACAHCPKTYADKSALRIHLLQHFGIKNHVCTICGLRLTTISKLKVHMNYHTKEKTHTCRFCNKVFNGLANMKSHVNLVHLGIKAYPCKECGRAFGKQETLRHHEMIHTGEKPEVCNVCGKRFIQRVALKKHMQTHEKHK